MTALADATDPRFTDGQRAHLARFEAAEVPAEVVEAGNVVERVARAIQANKETFPPAWETLSQRTRDHYRHMATAAVAAMHR